MPENQDGKVKLESTTRPPTRSQNEGRQNAPLETMDHDGDDEEYKEFTSNDVDRMQSLILSRVSFFLNPTPLTPR